MHEAIAEEWLAAGGCNTREDFLLACRLSAERLAEDAVGGLGLHEVRGFDRVELVEAFLRLKSELRISEPD